MNQVITKSAVLAGALAASGLAEAAEVAMPGSSWAPIGAAIAVGFGAAGAASAQGRAASAALEGIARNPGSRSEVFVPLLLSLVFMEFQALLCFVIAFLINR